MSSIDYYNKNAQAFYDRSIHADLSEAYARFLKYLPPAAHILDAGCGVGRDAKFFSDKGYNVMAFDASTEMVAMATKSLGRPVRLMSFDKIEFKSAFDAVWATLSLIHVPYSQTRSVLGKIHAALKPDGIFFSSYKYGNAAMVVGEREFFNMTETSILPYFSGLFDSDLINTQALAFVSEHAPCMAVMDTET